jgi:TolB-like protein/DNA-binding winged helix-turn-helix (wHTH) protein/Tfp pilus assembly protein PilF
LRRGCLYGGDREIELRRKSFEMLCYLVENAGRLISKDELIKAVWPNVTVADESLTRCVSDVRLALGDADQRIIKTLLRRGYLFAAPVSAGAVATNAAAVPPTPGSAGVPPALSTFDPGETPALRTPQSPPRLSLVVLPFVNLSGDPVQDYLADVITEGLTAYLSRIRDSFIIARTTAFTYNGKAVDVKQIGRELGVRYVLAGSAQRSGTRVSAQLIDADTSAHLWAGQFDADLSGKSGRRPRARRYHSDLLEMQDEIVTRLARELEIELTAVEAARISRTRVTKLDAEDFALRGEAIFLAYGVYRDEAEPGFVLCERALQIDPDNVRALSILAERFATRVIMKQSIDREADTRRADELASRALAVDPNSYHAHQAKARALLAHRRIEEAIVEARRSLSLNPGFIPAYRNLCVAAMYLGRPEEMIEYADKAMRLSPLDPYLALFHLFRATGCFMLQRDEDAIVSLQHAVANSPEFSTAIAWLAAVLALTDRDAEARDALKRYFLIRSTKTKTIAQWKSLAYSENPVYLAARERWYEGLRRAGMPEE